VLLLLLLVRPSLGSQGQDPPLCGVGGTLHRLLGGRALEDQQQGKGLHKHTDSTGDLSGPAVGLSMWVVGVMRHCLVGGRCLVDQQQCKDLHTCTQHR
jgi:hypothetical protein